MSLVCSAMWMRFRRPENSVITIFIQIHCIEAITTKKANENS